MSDQLDTRSVVIFEQNLSIFIGATAEKKRRKCESSEGNFTRTKAKIGVKIRQIRRFRTVEGGILVDSDEPIFEKR